MKSYKGGSGKTSQGRGAKSAGDIKAPRTKSTTQPHAGTSAVSGAGKGFKKK